MTEHTTTTLAYTLAELGDILDLVALCGHESLGELDPVFCAFVDWLRVAEHDALELWKIGQTRAQDSLLWQETWENQELRNSRGWLRCWNAFARSFQQRGFSRRVGEYSAWQSYVAYRLSDTLAIGRYLPCATAAEDYVSPQSLPPYTLAILQLFRAFFALDPDECSQSCRALLCPPDNRRFHPLLSQSNQPEQPGQQTPGEQLVLAYAQVLEIPDDQQAIDRLQALWRHNSGGVISLYNTFTFSLASDDSQAMLTPVFSVRPMLPFDRLYGIEYNQQRLIKNCEGWLSGGAGDHVLLWGERGTGKSSCVFALMERFAQERLKCVELLPQDIMHIRRLLGILAAYPERFIVFIDDLSLSTQDTDYVYLKTVLEGGVERCPGNVLLHVTSNRKNLAREERPAEEAVEEMGTSSREAKDERLALDDRFGLKLFFEAPQFGKLAELLYSCADEAALEYDHQHLLLRFRRFCLNRGYDRPAGRSVRRFVDEYKVNADC